MNLTEMEAKVRSASSRSSLSLSLTIVDRSEKPPMVILGAPLPL